MNIVPFWKTFVTRKMSTIFKSGLYSTFSNSTIMNKNKEVSHSKQETTHPSLHLSAPQNIILLVFSVTPFKIDQNKNQNRSIDKVQNLRNERRYIYKDPRQDSGQRNISHTRYPKKCFTRQTYCPRRFGAKSRGGALVTRAYIKESTYS